MIQIYVATEANKDQRRKTNDMVENINNIWKSDEIKLGWQGCARAGYYLQGVCSFLLLVASK